MNAGLMSKCRVGSTVCGWAQYYSFSFPDIDNCQGRFGPGNHRVSVEMFTSQARGATPERDAIGKNHSRSSVVCLSP